MQIGHVLELVIGDFGIGRTSFIVLVEIPIFFGRVIFGLNKLDFT